MKNKKFKILLLSLVVFFIADCGQTKRTDKITVDDVENVLQDFTEVRINQYLFLNETPRDNISLLVYVLNQRNINYNSFLRELKVTKPELYKIFTPAKGVPE